MARRGRPPSKPVSDCPPPTTSISIGNCRVEVPSVLKYELLNDGLSVQIPQIGSLTLKVDNEVPCVSTGLSFTLLNPKSLDGQGKLLLQDVLKLYNQELPAMNYAANTGKKSRFLQNCISNGKYCTLIMTYRQSLHTEIQVVGAATYQILPPDTQFAELPLAAVRHSSQRKGYGSLLYKELQRRLLDVGVLAIFCWGDQESEAFWAKQGFVTVADVDGRGRTKKLPIKGDLRKSMSIPGSATLMVSYPSGAPMLATWPANPVFPAVSECFDKAVTQTPPRLPSTLNFDSVKGSPGMMSITTPQIAGEIKSSQANNVHNEESPKFPSGVLHTGDKSITPHNMEVVLWSVASDEFLGEGALMMAPNARGELQNRRKVTGLKMDNRLMCVAAEALPSQVTPDAVPDPMGPDTIRDTGVPLTDVTNILIPSNVGRPANRRTDTKLKLTSTSERGDVKLTSTVASEKKMDEGKIDAGKDIQAAQGSTKGKLSAFLGLGAKGGLKRGKVSQEKLEQGKEIQEGMLCAFTGRKQPKRTRNCHNAGEKVETTQGKPHEDVGSARKELTDESSPVLHHAEVSSWSGSVEVLTGLKRGRVSPLKPFGRRSARRRRAGAIVDVGCEEDMNVGIGEERIPISPRGDTKGGALNDLVRITLPQSTVDPGDQNRESQGVRELSAHKSAIVNSSNTDVSTTNVNDQIGHPAPIPEKKDRESDQNNSTCCSQLPSHAMDSALCIERRDDCAGQQSIKPGHAIMFMNMANENQKKQLTKHVERLGGVVTSSGSECTHVITGEVRRTLNFCVAISSGSWILSPDWLKLSVKQKKFADEERYILTDRKFESKYQTSLQCVIHRAQQRPNLLLEGLHFYPTCHVHPPVETICQIIKAAGGKILVNLQEAMRLENKSVGFVVACEEDMGEAMAAAKAGLRTCTSDWLLTCVVKQDLDLSVGQFAESL